MSAARARLRVVAHLLPDLARQLVGLIDNPDRDRGDNALTTVERLRGYEGFYSRILPALFADVAALAREPGPEAPPDAILTDADVAELEALAARLRSRLPR